MHACMWLYICTTGQVKLMYLWPAWTRGTEFVWICEDSTPHCSKLHRPDTHLIWMCLFYKWPKGYSLWSISWKFSLLIFSWESIPVCMGLIVSQYVAASQEEPIWHTVIYGCFNNDIWVLQNVGIYGLHNFTQQRTYMCIISVLVIYSILFTFEWTYIVVRDNSKMFCLLS